MKRKDFIFSFLIQSRILFFLIILFLHFLQSANGQLKIGDWRDHYPYTQAISLTDLGDKIYCASTLAMFSFNKNDNSIEKFSQVQGLSDISISFVKYSPDYKTLLVAYQNGNIDLIQSTGVTNLSDILRSSVAGKKNINNALFIGQYVYLSCDFGIVVLDLEKKEFKDTYFIGENGDPMPVYEIALLNEKLYAATERGVLSANIDDPLLVDFTHWIRESGIPNSYTTYTAIVSLGSELFVNQTETINSIDSVFKYNGTAWEYFTNSNGKNWALYAGANKLILTGDKLLHIYSGSSIPQHVISDYGWGVIDPRNALIDIAGTLWISDHMHGLVKSDDYNFFDGMFPNGPYLNDVYSMHFNHNTLWISGGGLTQLWSNLWKNGQINSFNSGSWKSKFYYSVQDIVNVVSHPSDPNLTYAATWGSGLLELAEDEIVTIFNEENSSLQANSQGASNIRTYGLLFDRNSNLWVSNSNVTNPISVKTPSGSWKSFRFNGQASNMALGSIIETDYGDKWVFAPRDGKLLIFNENQTIEDESDDGFKRISLVDQDGKTYQEINCIAEDLDGNIWVGTNQGPLVYYSPGDILYGGNTIAQKVKIPRNDGSGLADYLLNTEEITTIVVDGANRKWFGTKDAGAFLFSADATQEINSLSKETSPLPSNWITAMAIDPKSGEVYIGTEYGTLSYKGSAISPTDNMAQVYVYPNPVRENYYGPITITGLVEDADVKITDISGNLVNVPEVLGGQAIWDGTNQLGERVKTGVYMVFISNKDGSQTFITKILFIN